jgi:flagellin-like protein
MSRRKAISPVISVVLMIAVAISVAILVTTWVTNLTQRQIAGDKSCAINTNYVIESVEWNKSNQYNATLLIKITNRGKQQLYGFGVEIDNGTRIINFDYGVVDQGGITSSNKLGRERSVYVLVNLTNTTLMYPAFGRSLVSSDEATVKVTNEACDAVSSETNKVS